MPIKQDLMCAMCRQVIYSCSCQLVLPKHAMSGTMRLTALHVHFIGEVQQPPDESGARSGSPNLLHSRVPASAMSRPQSWCCRVTPN